MCQDAPTVGREGRGTFAPHPITIRVSENPITVNALEIVRGLVNYMMGATKLPLMQI